MEDTETYDPDGGLDGLDPRTAAAIEALRHESLNLREAAEIRAKTALDLKAASEAQVRVASTVNLINGSMAGAFRALSELRSRVSAYRDETAQAADELLAEADTIEAGLRANQQETFEAVTRALGSAMAGISGPADEGAPLATAGPREAEGPAARPDDGHGDDLRPGASSSEQGDGDEVAEAPGPRLSPTAGFGSQRSIS